MCVRGRSDPRGQPLNQTVADAACGQIVCGECHAVLIVANNVDLNPVSDPRGKDATDIDAPRELADPQNGPVDVDEQFVSFCNRRFERRRFDRFQDQDVSQRSNYNAVITAEFCS